MSRTQRIILGIDPGLAHTGWGVVSQDGPRLACVAYGCVTTSAADALSRRLLKVHDQIGAVVRHRRLRHGPGPRCGARGLRGGRA